MSRQVNRCFPALMVLTIALFLVGSRIVGLDRPEVAAEGGTGSRKRGRAGR